MNEDQLPQFNSLKDKIFTDYKGKIFIGREEIKSELLSVLKEQARYLETSQLYEILMATLKNEAADLALIQSKDWDNVQFAKALHHCAFVFEAMIVSLKNQKVDNN